MDDPISNIVSEIVTDLGLNFDTQKNFKKAPAGKMRAPVNFLCVHNLLTSALVVSSKGLQVMNVFFEKFSGETVLITLKGD